MTQLFLVTSAPRHLQRGRKNTLSAAKVTVPQRKCAWLAICLALSVSTTAALAQSPDQGSGGSGTTQGNAAPNRARQLAALKKACDTGALSQEECQQRMASFNAQSSPQPRAPARAYALTQGEAAQKGMAASNDPNFDPNDPYLNPSAPSSNPNPPAPSRTGVYRDSQGRYSLTVPDGWTTTPARDNSGTLKLTNGPASATVTLMTWAGDNAAKPKDITYAVLDDLAKQYSNGGLGDQGSFKNNGHAAFRAQASGDDSKGARVAALAVSVQIRGKDFISVVMTAPMDQADAAAEQMRQMVQSIRFAGE